MRALSLYQPYATLIAVGAKRFETRAWRSRMAPCQIAIHAAACRNVQEIDDAEGDDRIRAALGFDPALGALIDQLPFGAVVATARLTRCIPTEEVDPAIIYARRCRPGKEGAAEFWREVDLGNFMLRRYAWQLEDIVALPAPVPAKGSFGLWEWTP